MVSTTTKYHVCSFSLNSLKIFHSKNHCTLIENLTSSGPISCWLDKYLSGKQSRTFFSHLSKEKTNNSGNPQKSVLAPTITVIDSPPEAGNKPIIFYAHDSNVCTQDTNIRSLLLNPPHYPPTYTIYTFLYFLQQPQIGTPSLRMFRNPLV